VPGRVPVQLPQHRLMTAVQAIKIADSHRTALVAGMQIVESSYQSHRAGTGENTGL
jgi:hypothetical protein